MHFSRNLLSLRLEARLGGVRVRSRKRCRSKVRLLDPEKLGKNEERQESDNEADQKVLGQHVIISARKLT